MNKLLVTLLASAFAVTAFAQAPKSPEGKAGTPKAPASAEAKKTEKKPAKAKGEKKAKSKAKADEKKAATK
jgi:Ni/Co efflux regulator RcnB